jgi:hypothetical protein
MSPPPPPSLPERHTTALEEAEEIPGAFVVEANTFLKVSALVYLLYAVIV